MARRFVCSLPLVLAFALGCGSSVSDDAGGDQGVGGSTTQQGSGGVGGEGGDGGNAPGCDVPADAGEFEIGTGEDCFTRVAQGEVVPMMQGPQGGYHLWIAIGCSDCTSSMHLRWGARDPETGMAFPDSWDSEAVVDLTGDTWLQRAGIISGLPGVSWDPEGFPPLPEGTHAIMFVDVLEGGQVVRHAEVEIVIGEVTPWDPCIEDPNHELCETFG